MDDTNESRGRSLKPEEQDPKLWKGDGWTAKIVKNIDDDGWAVEMIADGASEPSLVGPWTMGRDKKSPKPIDTSSFATLLKGANEILARHAQQRRAQLHRSVTTEAPNGERVRVDCDVVPDEDDPLAEPRRSPGPTSTSTIFAPSRVPTCKRSVNRIYPEAG